MTQRVTPAYGPSPVQIEAIRVAMRVFLEDDLAAGPPQTDPRPCARCHADRPGAGFISYDGVDLCHTCAVSFEILRAGVHAGTVADFVDGRLERLRPVSTIGRGHHR
jgi:hypothetical protein